MKHNFLDTFSKNFQISSFIKIRPAGAEFFHANGQTDGLTDRCDEANIRFSQFRERVWKQEMYGPHDYARVCCFSSKESWVKFYLHLDSENI